MNQEVKQKWITALRSGTYKQGTKRLRGIDNTYCCLGVLCELAVKAGIIPEPESPPGTDRFSYGLYKETNYLPAEVVNWADLDRQGKYGRYGSLANDNDYGKTFEEIAHIIEENF